MSWLVRAAIKNSPERVPEEIAFNFAELQFIKPSGIVFLSNFIHWLSKQGCKVRFEGLTADSSALRYLDDSLFFEQHSGKKLNQAAKPRSTTRPLVQIANRESYAWLDLNLVPWLSSQTGIPESSFLRLRTCLSEIFNNIQHHTKYDIGSVFAQHFPTEGEIVIAISDFGCGIPTSVRTKLPELSDSDAILQAVREGFTTRSIPTNKGAGLDYLLRCVVDAHGGSVTIYSHRAMVRFEGNGTNISFKVFQDVGFSPGTTIEISLKTDAIEAISDESEDLKYD
ncbi:MAG: sensor histidine kinase [Hyphomicrobiales bacterium]|nr:sensor histidine kinase [Hyphomicrobiales bacterium]